MINVSMRRYDYFDYKLPTGTAEEYGARAREIFDELGAAFPAQYKRAFRAPSEALTISGVRAFDTYYDLGRDVSAGLVTDLKAFFRHKQILLVEETFPFGGEDNQTHRYSLVNLPALAKLTDHYGHIPAWRPFEPAKTNAETDFFVWWEFWKERMANLLFDPSNQLPLQKWVRQDWFVFHNISFGMLLGYPGEAICSLLWEPDSVKRMLDARIRHAAKYNGAQPVYFYAKKLANHPHIRAHEALWSGILDHVYR